MLLNVLVIGGFAAAWGIVIALVAAHDRRLRILEQRWEKLEGLWKI